MTQAWVLALVVFSFWGNAQAAVWEATNTWSDAWEDRYSRWVQTHWSEDFFRRPGLPTTGLTVDCADAVYTMRAVFAHDHGLPFAMRDPSGGRRPITSNMGRWDSRSPDQRYRSFLNYIHAMGSTQTLPGDSIPVAINRDHVRAGGFIVTDKDSHHSWTIQNISDTGVPRLVFASRPASANLFVRNSYPSIEFMFPNGIREESRAGIRKFRGNDQLFTPETSIDGFSLEQYGFRSGRWRETVQARLALRTESHEERLSRLLTDVCEQAQRRIDNVQQALDAIAGFAEGQCLGFAAFDDLSTPSRDRQLRDTLIDLRQSWRRARSHTHEISARTLSEARAVLEADDDSYCYLDFGSSAGSSRHRGMTIRTLARRSLGNMLSSNPNDSFEYRWGYHGRRHSPRAEGCPEY